MNILFTGAECYPFIKVGGLGDVIGSLPKELNKLGNDARVIMPKYKTIKPALLKNALMVKEAYQVNMGGKNYDTNLWKLVYKKVIYYFVDCDYFFGRDKVYGFDDEEERWAFFQIAAIEAMKYMDDYKVEVMSCHDWHTAMIPHLLKSRYYESYNQVKTTFTVHNVLFQGSFDKETVQLFNIPYEGILEHDGRMNWMKSAIVESDYCNTVSETYARELVSSDFYGEGLSQYFNQKMRQGKFLGIINGIDYEVFNPEKDKQLEVKYNFENYKEGKLSAKEQLYKELGVDFYTDVPLIGICSRLTGQKGLDLVQNIIEDVIHDYTFKLVVIGTGEERYEKFFSELEERHPYKVKCYFGYSDELAHLLYAASDMFLMPSRFEPCGLGQMIALKYGTLPIVRETGGLKDSVTPYNEYTLTGNGFSFSDYNSHDMFYVIKYAFRTYYQHHCWDILVQNAMSSDFSFRASSLKYNEMFKNALEGDK